MTILHTVNYSLFYNNQKQEMPSNRNISLISKQERGPCFTFSEFSEWHDNLSPVESLMKRTTDMPM